MRSLLALAIALLAALVIYMYVQVDDDTPAVDVAPTRVDASDDAEGPDLTSDPLQGVVAPPPSVAHDARTDALATSGPFTISGSVLLPGGAPAVGARVRCWSFQAGSPPSEREQRTDADGRFAFPFAPGADSSLLLKVSHDGYAVLQSTHPAEERDLVAGPYRLSVAGVVVVRLVDAEGGVPPGEWTVSLWSEDRSRDEVVRPAPGQRPASPADGSARIDGLLPGTWRAMAATKTSGWVRATDPVEVRAGETASVEIRYDGPDASRTVWVRAHTRPHPSRHRPSLESYRLIGPGSEERTLPADADEARFVALPPGTYTAVIDDPRYERWSQPGVAPGESVSARLVATAGARLTVVDASDGAAVDAFRVDVRVEDDTDFANEYTLHEADDELPDNGVLRVLPMDQTLLVSAEGFGVTEVPLIGLQPHEVRDVTAELARTVKVQGRVVRADGTTPAPGAIVHLHEADAPATPHEPGLERWSSSRIPTPIQMVRADEVGYFELEAPAGTYALHARLNRASTARIDPFVVQEGGADDWVVVRLPGMGTLHGRLVGGDPSSVAGMTIDVYSPHSSASLVDPLGGGFPEVDAAGRFMIEDLPEGDFDLLLQAPPNAYDTGGGMRMSFARRRIELGRVTIPAGETTELDFDLADEWPATMNVRAAVDGAAVPGLAVFLTEPGSSRASSATDLDEAGRAVLRGAASGDHDVVIVSFQGPWQAVVGRRRLGPGAAVHVDANVRLARGLVRVIDDATGDPLANTRLQLRMVPMTKTIGTTDGAGNLDLTLPAGTFDFVTVADLHDPRPLRGTLDWTDVGPASDELRMRAPDK